MKKRRESNLQRQITREVERNKEYIKQNKWRKQQNDRSKFVTVNNCVNHSGCDQIPEKINLDKEIFILAHCFRGFRPWFAGSLDSGLVVRQYIMAESHCRESSSSLNSQDAERDKKTADKICPSRAYLQWSLSSNWVLLLVVSNISHSPFKYKPISELIHWWDQSIHDPSLNTIALGTQELWGNFRSKL